MDTINNRYTIERAIGKGASSEVYQVVDRLTHETLALKRLSPDAQLFSELSLTDLRFLFMREFRVLASLRHPNIMDVIDYGFDEFQQPYFTMTLLENGQDLLSYGVGCSFSEKIDLLLQVLQALKYLHRHGVIHRDLKPSNILVDPYSQTVKVLDFGLSQMLGIDSNSRLDDHLVGTMLYIPPEVLSGQDVTPQSDFYSLGIIAYELFTGQHPYPHSSISQLLNGILQSTPDLTPIPDLLQPIIQRLLQVQPKDRYASAGEIIMSLSRQLQRPTPPEDPHQLQSFTHYARFVGRKDEYRQLSHAFDRVREGHGSAWLIGGESGIGKSRLLDEVRVLGLVSGALVLTGQGVEGGGLPFQLWRKILRRLALIVPIEPTEQAVIAEFMPDIGHDTPLQPVSVISNEQQMATVISDLLRRACGMQKPILVLLEDLHWVSESLRPLQMLLPFISKLPLMIVGTYRDDERPALPELLPNSHLIKLKRFTAEVVGELTQAILGQQPDHAKLIAFLQRETEGNAFFLVETIYALAEASGDLDQVVHQILPEYTTSQGIERLIQRRLVLIPPREYRLLQIAAIIGREIDLAVMAFIQPQLNHWLYICSNAAVIEIYEQGWRFRHDKFRESLLQTMPPEQTQQDHRRVAIAITEIYADDPTYAAVLAEHWRIAGDDIKEAYYAEEAGRFADELNLLREAHHFYTRALELLHDEKRRVQIKLRLGDVHARMGNYQESLRYLQMVLNHKHATPESRVKALNLITRTAYQRGDLAWAIEQAEQALQLARTIGNLREVAQALNNLGVIAYYRSMWEESRRWHLQSLEIRRQIKDLAGIASSLNNLGSVTEAQGDYRLASEYYQSSLVEWRRINNTWGMAMGQTNLAHSLCAQDQLTDALKYYHAALLEAQRTGSISLILEIIVGRAMVYFKLSDYINAARWLGMALNHSAANSDVRTYADPVVKALYQCLSDAEVTCYFAEGAALDFNEQIEQWVVQIGQRV
ncbi:MAG: protein kinase [Anaerolineae bacterium]|jgi:tetratricopeptide (TPR) repeat protein/tRNA A-37 threonylcarbamoyl transferase component Bud32|nr:protein kinase [Anaerolineae bacterium]